MDHAAVLWGYLVLLISLSHKKSLVPTVILESMVLQLRWRFLQQLPMLRCTAP